jgi:hypothetical protein
MTDAERKTWSHLFLMMLTDLTRLTYELRDSDIYHASISISRTFCTVSIFKRQKDPDAIPMDTIFSTTTQSSVRSYWNVELFNESMSELEKAKQALLDIADEHAVDQHESDSHTEQKIG